MRPRLAGTLAMLSAIIMMFALAWVWDAADTGAQTWPALAVVALLAVQLGLVAVASDGRIK